MAAFDFTVPIYGFDQWSADATTNNTVRYTVGTTFTLDPSASLVVIDVEDDDGNPAGSSDNLFSDGFIDTPGDGSPSNTSNNDQLLSQPVTVNGQTFQVGDQVELEFAFQTTTGEEFWVIRIDGTNVGISGAVLPTPGTTYEVGSSADSQATPFQDVPCFTSGALVETPSGVVAIEHLRAGDTVMTLDHGPQEILWAGSRTPSVLEFKFFAQLQSITIKRGALGPDLPNRDTTVSQQHRVLVQSDRAAYLFGESEVLATALSMVNGHTIFPTPGKPQVTYYHLLLARHEILIVNGMPTESLYPGTKRLRPEVLMDMELSGIRHKTNVPFARRALRSYEALLLAS